MAEKSSFDLSQFFYSSLDLLCIAGNDGYFKMVNPAFIQTLGYTEEELLRIPYVKFVFPDDLEKTQKEAHKLSLGIPTVYFENRYICKDGSIKWLSWKSTLVNNNVLAIARDITRVKQTEEILRENERELIKREAENKYKETFERVGIGLAHVALDGQLLFVNNEVCKILGFTANELVKKNFNDLLAPDDVRTTEGERKDLVDGKIEVLSRERKLIRKDGRHIWTLATSSVVRSDNQLKYYILALKDITKRKEIEESFRTLAEAIPQMVWISERDGKSTYISNRWLEYAGISDNESIDWKKLIHPNDYDKSVNEWTKCVETGKVFEVEYRLLNATTNVYRWHLARAQAVKNSDGIIIKWFGTCTDIDDQKKIQEELRQSIFELNRTTHEKAKLIASERAAIESSRLKSEFLANMSHEIRTPLNGVIGMAGLLLETRLSDMQKDYAETILQSANTLLGVLNDVLDISKIEAGKLELENLDFKMNDLISTVKKTLQYSATKKGLQLTVDDLPDTYFQGDPSRIRQVIFNLVHNAIKFTSKGSVKINFSFQDSKQLARFEIRDTGIGISEQNLREIFIPFSQGDASTTRRYGGTGLGLSICKRLVELMDGNIGVESKEGKGSSFWFEIPLKVKQSEEKRHIKKKNSDLKSHARLRILVAEDNSINQKVVKRMLQNMGHYVDVVANGKEVLISLENIPYDIIFMDCHMPEMDGFTATRKIRSLKTKVRNIPIIALTADVLKGTKDKCLAYGMNDYIRKPVHLEDLNSTLRKYIRSRPVRKTSKKVIAFNKKAIKKLQAMNGPGLPDIVEELMTEYTKKMPERISKINSAVENKNFNLLEEEAHSLKSTSAILGISKIHKICEILEKKAHLNDFNDVENLVNKLIKNYQGIEKHLLVYCKAA